MSAMPQGQLAVGTHIAEKCGFGPLEYVGSQQRTGRVCAHKSMQTAGQVGGAGQQRLLVTKEMVCHEGRAGQAVQVASGEEVEHGRIAGDNEHIDLADGNLRLGASCRQKGFQSGFHLYAQQFRFTVQGSVDAADDIRSH